MLETSGCLEGTRYPSALVPGGGERKTGLEVLPAFRGVYIYTVFGALKAFLYPFLFFVCSLVYILPSSLTSGG